MNECLLDEFFNTIESVVAHEVENELDDDALIRQRQQGACLEQIDYGCFHVHVQQRTQHSRRLFHDTQLVDGHNDLMQSIELTDRRGLLDVQRLGFDWQMLSDSDEEVGAQWNGSVENVLKIRRD